jgi:DNA-binding SARP family transcriptional activator/Tfp pilus assembly protein PilF
VPESLRLLTLGGLGVVRADGTATELSSQRRRIAVLAIAAAAAPGGVTRDRLLALLWPDAETERGRHALAQLVYNLRRDLGTSPIEGSTELRLVPDVMSSDLADFRAAIARGDGASAVELYRGPFLDGFYVPDAGEFERWTEEERQRLARQALAAAESLVAAASAADDLPAIVRWTGRLAELDPLSARHALAHMRALARRGDREAAIAHGRRYAALARADLSGEIDTAIEKEIERLQAQAITGLAAPHAAPVTAPDKSDAGAPPLGPTSAAMPAASSEAPPTVIPRTGLRRWRLPIATTLVALTAFLAWRSSRPPALTLAASDRVLLADAQVPSADSASARALRLALEAALRQSDRSRLMSPDAIREVLRQMGRPGVDLPLGEAAAREVAERAGARYVILLTLGAIGADSSRAVDLAVIEPGSGSTVRAYSGHATTTDLVATIGRVAGQLRRDLGDTRGDVAAAVPLPLATTPSLDALKLFESGNRAFNAGRYSEARALYAGALALDSSFAAAHAALGGVEFVTNHPTVAAPHLDRAIALSPRLPAREQLLLEASVSRWRGAWSRAAVFHRAYLTRYPDDYDTYLLLGYDLFRAGDFAEAIEAFDSARAHRPLSANSWLNVAASNSELGRYPAARAAWGEALRMDTTLLVRNFQNHQFGMTLMRLGFPDSARAVYRLMLERAPLDQARGHRSLGYVDLYEGRYASAVAHFQAAIRISAGDSTVALTELRDRLLLANAHLDLGQTSAARYQVMLASRLAIEHPLEARSLFWVGKPAARLGDTRLAATVLDSLRRRMRPDNREEQAAAMALDAEVHAALGEPQVRVDSARAAVAADDGPMYRETLAWVLERAGDADGAQREYEALAAAPERAFGAEGQQLARLAPLKLAALDQGAGRGESARRRLRAFADQWPNADQDLPFLVVPLRARVRTGAR